MRSKRVEGSRLQRGGNKDVAQSVPKKGNNADSTNSAGPAPGPSKSTAGETLYFYGHHKESAYNSFSQHYPCTFTAPSPVAGEADQTYNSTEQYMMQHKALLFSDDTIAAQIMETSDPRVQKALGRKVRGFREDVWRAHRERIVEEGNWWKFRNGRGAQGALRPLLLATAARELVEASPRDSIWGIGFAKADAEAFREKWGLNLLGKALMRVRERLRAEDQEAMESEGQ
jgi:ribA/ribD-fused uncharacterized protein